MMMFFMAEICFFAFKNYNLAVFLLQRWLFFPLPMG